MQNCNISGGVGRVSKSYQGGVKKLYIFPFNEYNVNQMRFNGQTLISFPQTTMYEWDINQPTFSESAAKAEGGNTQWSQKLDITIPQTTAGREFYKLLAKDHCAIVLDRLGNYRVLGLKNGLEVSSYSNTAGSSMNSLNGYTISLSGKEDNQAYFVADLSSTGFNIYDSSFGVNNFVFDNCDNYIFEDGSNYIFNN
jgi:hypothetical protein